MKHAKKLSFRNLMLLQGLVPCFVFGLPHVSEVVSGDVAFSQKSDDVMVIEAGNHSIINYQSFGIDVGQTVEFVQPNSRSSVLNRVIGEDPSRILGNLTSNGRVFLVNSHGIYFGSDSQVNVGSLVASTMDMLNVDFIQDRFCFVKGVSSSEIINRGSVEAAGDVVFLASRISNEGVVVARVGKIVLASGEKVTLDFSEERLMSFAIEGSNLDAEIIQTGALAACTGEIYLSIGAAKKAIEGVINIDGIVIGAEIIEEGGSIFLVGSSSLEAKAVHINGNESSLIAIDGVVNISDNLDLGGAFTVFGGEVSLGSCTIDASGAFGGGEVLVLAKEVHMSSLSTIVASATALGSGGRVLLRSSEKTSFEGSVFATGGNQGGDGGFVETSSEGDVEVIAGYVDTSAPLGERGTWFLNPVSISNDFFDSHAHVVLSLKGESRIKESISIKQSEARLTLQSDSEGGVIYLHSNISTEGGEIVFKDPVQISGGGTISIDSNGANIIFKSTVDGDSLFTDLILAAGTSGFIQCDQSLGKDAPLGAFSITSGQEFLLSGDLITNGKTVSLHVPLTLLDNVKIDTTAYGSDDKGADILLLQNVSGNYRLQINAGSEGVVMIQEGSSVNGAALSSVLVKAGSIQMAGDMRADGGTLVFDGPVGIAADLSLIDAGPTGIIFLDTLYSIGIPRSLTLEAPLGKVSFLGEVGGVLELQDLTVSSRSIEIQSDITVEGSLDLQGAVTLIGDTIITASSITFEKTVDGSYDLSLDVGASGLITISNRVGSSLRIGDFSIINAGTVSTKSICANTITQLAGSVLTTFDGALDTIYAGGINLIGTDFTFTTAIKTQNRGGFSITQSGTAIINSFLELSGSFSQVGLGAVNLSGNITTDEQSIIFEGPVVLYDNVSFNTGDLGEGAITFSEVVDGAYSLFLNLGEGDLTFLKAIGSSTPLGDIIIQSVKDLVVTEAIHSESYTQLSGFGTGTYLENITTLGGMGIYIFSNYLNFAGKVEGQLLSTGGQGNIVLNAVYEGVGSSINPVEVNVFDAGLGVGDGETDGIVFVGAFGPVYLFSQAGKVTGVGCVRTNPSYLVLYENGSGGYVNVTPNCGANGAPCPTCPTCPTCPPSSNCPSNLTPNVQGENLNYVPGIYTNYWQFKDTLGAPWYFNEILDPLSSLERNQMIIKSAPRESTSSVLMDKVSSIESIPLVEDFNTVEEFEEVVVDKTAPIANVSNQEIIVLDKSWTILKKILFFAVLGFGVLMLYGIYLKFRWRY